MPPTSKVNYAPANRDDPSTATILLDGNKAALEPLDKSNRSLWQKLAFYSCLAGFGFIVLGVVFAFVMEPLVKSRIRADLPLVDGTKAFEGWKTPPVTPLLFVRFFNLTNEPDFMAGESMWSILTSLTLVS